MDWIGWIYPTLKDGIFEHCLVLVYICSTRTSFIFIGGRNQALLSQENWESHKFDRSHGEELREFWEKITHPTKHKYCTTVKNTSQ